MFSQSAAQWLLARIARKKQIFKVRKKREKAQFWIFLKSEQYHKQKKPFSTTCILFKHMLKSVDIRIKYETFLLYLLFDADEK